MDQNTLVSKYLPLNLFLFKVKDCAKTSIYEVMDDKFNSKGLIKWDSKSFGDDPRANIMSSYEFKKNPKVDISEDEYIIVKGWVKLIHQKHMEKKNATNRK